MDQKSIQLFSDSIRSKIPAIRQVKNVANALWILRNPVRLSSDEKAELVDFVKASMKESMQK